VSFLRTAVLVTAVLLLDGCAQSSEVKSSMKVELDAFSGRPNPSWTLSPEDAEELTKRLQGLRSVDQAPVEPGLGYRGFVLSSPEREIRVYQGFVTVKEGGITKRYADVNQIERWLTEQAQQRGYGSIVSDGTP